MLQQLHVMLSLRLIWVGERLLHDQALPSNQVYIDSNIIYLSYFCYADKFANTRILLNKQRTRYSFLRKLTFHQRWYTRVQVKSSSIYKKEHQEFINSVLKYVLNKRMDYNCCIIYPLKHKQCGSIVDLLVKKVVWIWHHMGVV